jgi:hypothetical protein
LGTWMNRVSGEGWKWYVKILSGNDTLLNDSHQAGPYVPKDVVFELFPTVARSNEKNPRVTFAVQIDSHATGTHATAIWYNNRVIGEGTRNEARITGWGGRTSPILDPEATGSICILAFRQEDGRDAAECRVWVCSSIEEEDLLIERLGPLEPGRSIFLDAAGATVQLSPPAPRDSPCTLGLEQIPPSWRLRFPEAQEIVARAVSHLPSVRRKVSDDRLVRRRECEFGLFRSLEEALVLPRIREGFATVDLFVNFALSVTNRRKSRSGVSLELHAKTIFDEEHLSYSYDETSEERKRPDFLFPSAEAYRDTQTSPDRLRMLAVKTTCKDRWRQILNEADRIPKKHLLTLQEGVSLHQFAEMRAENVTLVVPHALHETYPEAIRSSLLTLEQFIQSTWQVCK